MLLISKTVMFLADKRGIRYRYQSSPGDDPEDQQECGERKGLHRLFDVR